MEIIPIVVTIKEHDIEDIAFNELKGMHVNMKDHYS